MTKDWKLYALHILESIDKIEMILKRGDIRTDVVLYDAVLRNLQTMSEATRHLPENKTIEYPEIPWKNISGFRNILVHDYMGDIDSQTILDVINNHIYPLRKTIQDMLN